MIHHVTYTPCNKLRERILDKIEHVPHGTRTRIIQEAQALLDGEITPKQPQAALEARAADLVEHDRINRRPGCKGLLGRMFNQQK